MQGKGCRVSPGRVDLVRRGRRPERSCWDGFLAVLLTRIYIIHFIPRFLHPLHSRSDGRSNPVGSIGSSILRHTDDVLLPDDHCPWQPGRACTPPPGHCSRLAPVSSKAPSHTNFTHHALPRLRTFTPFICHFSSGPAPRIPRQHHARVFAEVNLPIR